jgi:non-specific serine/threonine protein kinase
MSAASSESATESASATTPAAASPRRIGGYELLSLLGRSTQSMLWLAQDDSGMEVHLLLPRQQPADAAARQAWTENASRAARLQHPRIAKVLEVGVADRWPFVVSARAQGVTLAERLRSDENVTAPQAAQWLCDFLPGLAFLHEGDALHGDVGLHTILIDPQGRALLMPFGGGDPAVSPAAGISPTGSASRPLEPNAERTAIERDVFASGLVLYRLLAGAPALDEEDLPTAVVRAQREIVRLGWAVRIPIPEALRAVTNRATEREPTRRYLGARSLERALQGWIDAQAEGGGGVLALLMDRLRLVGHLPMLPSTMARLRVAVSTDRLRIREVTEVIIQDPALSFELWRRATAAQFGNPSSTPTLTVSRAVQLLGVEGLQRTANNLRVWPGHLSPVAADALGKEMSKALTAAHVARTLCPADMDGEVAYLIALLQNLGPLLMHFHFPDEALQIAHLREPAESGKPGMDEATAAFAVIGVEIDDLAMAVARHWRLDESLQKAMVRVPTDISVQPPSTRDEMLRLLASAASEAVLASLVPEAKGAAGSAAALQRVNQRYARPLVLAPNELTSAFEQARLDVELSLPPLSA